MDQIQVDINLLSAMLCTDTSSVRVIWGDIKPVHSVTTTTTTKSNISNDNKSITWCYLHISAAWTHHKHQKWWQCTGQMSSSFNSMLVVASMPTMMGLH